MNEPYRYSPPVVMPPSEDERYLKILGIFHYVLAGFAALFSLFPSMYIFLGVMAAELPSGRAGTPGAREGEMMGGIFVAIGVFGVLFCLASAVMLFLAGKAIAARNRSTLIIISACIICLWVPFGTVLGVFTLVLMQRPAVKALFTAAQAQQT